MLPGVSRVGFASFATAKPNLLNACQQADWIIYYSPKEQFEKATPCQKFTAIGKVVGLMVYPVEMCPGFVPYRRDIRFLEASAIPIRPLLEQLSFIKDKSKWGYAFRFGHLEIPKPDFERIAIKMLGQVPLDS